MNDKIYTVDEVATALHTNVQTVYKLLQGGFLGGHKKLRKWYVLHSDIIDYLKAKDTPDMSEVA